MNAQLVTTKAFSALMKGSNYVTWPGMFQDVENYIKNCEICQKNKFTGPYTKAHFQETDTQF